jgi:cell division septation protein DedD
MTRDYRYGHKVKKPTVRRTQEKATNGDVVTAESEKKSQVHQSSVWSGESERRKAVGVNLGRRLIDGFKREEPKPSEDTAPSASIQRVKQARDKLKSERSDDVQKILDEAYRLSQPKAIRIEAEKRAQQAKKEAEAYAQEQAELQALAHEKKQSHFGWGMWIAMTLLILSGISWLLYAPFFLAFAFEMQWIDESTRNRLDPAAAMRSQAITSLSKDEVKPATQITKPTLAVPVAPDMEYSFYRELPKASIVTGAQPLPVRTHAPVYLQLAAIPNEKEAQAERKRLAQKGYLVQMTAQLNKGQSVYVLRMGPYDDQRVINRLKVELQRLGVDAHELSVIALIKASERESQQQNNLSESQLTLPSAVAPSRGDVQQQKLPR